MNINPFNALASVGKSVAGVFNKRYEVKDNKQFFDYDLTRGEQSIDQEIQRNLNNSWKDEFLLPLIASPLVIGFLISFIMFFTLSTQYIMGLMELEVFIDELYEVALVMPHILDSLSAGYEFILLCVVLSSFGLRRFILPYFQIKQSGQARKPVVNVTRDISKPDNDPLLEKIKREEGYSAEIYQDINDNPTIGWGINLNAFDKERAEAVLRHDIRQARKHVYPFIRDNDLPFDVYDALTELAFWVGASGFNKFVKMKEALVAHDFKLARQHFEDSRLYRRHPTRAKTLAEKIY